ncbi:MAG: transmembrane protein, distant homology with ydbS, partial [uncultured Solirubrobacteraceae bacterium]
ERRPAVIASGGPPAGRARPRAGRRGHPGGRSHLGPRRFAGGRRSPACCSGAGAADAGADPHPGARGPCPVDAHRLRPGACAGTGRRRRRCSPRSRRPAGARGRARRRRGGAARRGPSPAALAAVALRGPRAGDRPAPRRLHRPADAGADEPRPARRHAPHGGLRDVRARRGRLPHRRRRQRDPRAQGGRRRRDPRPDRRPGRRRRGPGV